jgi:hypothetical protein
MLGEVYMKNFINSRKKEKLKVFFILTTFSIFLSFPFKSATAACASCTMYQTAIETEFNTHFNWMKSQWWDQYFEPSLKKLANEYRNAVYLHTVTFGAFLDGQSFNGALRTVQDLTATSLKTYTPSDSLCRFGTLSKSLAFSEAKGDANQLVLAKRSQNRQLGQQNLSSAEGEQMDRLYRMNQFRAKFCDGSDFNGAIKPLCNGTPSDTRHNMDINFTRAVDTKNTLNVDFTDNTMTDDEENILALANNLYAHKVFNRIDGDALKNDSNTDLRSTYLDQRSIVAKRSVAENSFYELIGQKSSGGVQSKDHFVKVLQYLGLSEDDAKKYLGDNPSYDVQMEVLTKKIYQDPAFYANLMDSPTNVNRQYAAMQAFGLMQKRDIFDTISRSEILMSLLLELEVAKYQDSVQNRQN